VTAVTLLLRGGEPVGFDITGHTGLAQAGQDILCAAISSAAYLAANTILEVIGAEAETAVADGEMKILVSARDEEKCRDILKGFELHITQLCKQYPRGIRIIKRNIREGA